MAPPAPTVADRRETARAVQEPATELIGREVEVAEVVELLVLSRVVTLTGPPGVGKSRLALEAARVLQGAGRADHVVVNVASTTDPAELEALVARARAERAHAAPAHARTGPATLVVLDDCDGAIADCAGLVGCSWGGRP